MYKESDERELARLCSEGDRLAEEELYKRYAARVYTLCRRYSAQSADDSDLLQEVFIKALGKISSYKYSGPGSLYSWICRLAVNLALNQIRRKHWVTVSFDRQAGDDIPEPTEAQLGAIPQEKLLEWISALPDMKRAVFNLYCIDGYSHKEIGRKLGISEKGSAGMLAKARKQLKEEIKSYLKDTER